MPDWKSLKVGDRIRLLCVPKADLEQRAEEFRRSAQMAGWTADTIERIIESDPVVIIDHIDEYGCPYHERQLPSANGEIEHHTLSITDEQSWEFVSPE
jgi:hypothetical protein